MDCPKCKGCTTVIGTKSDGSAVYRERRCLDCGHIFHTEEHLSESSAKYKELVYLYFRERKIRQQKASKRYEKGDKR